MNKFRCIRQTFQFGRIWEVGEEMNSKETSHPHFECITRGKATVAEETPQEPVEKMRESTKKKSAPKKKKPAKKKSGPKTRAKPVIASDHLESAAKIQDDVFEQLETV